MRTLLLAKAIELQPLRLEPEVDASEATSWRRGGARKSHALSGPRATKVSSSSSKGPCGNTRFFSGKVRAATKAVSRTESTSRRLICVKLEKYARAGSRPKFSSEWRLLAEMAGSF